LGLPGCNRSPSV
jgi:hypothetical protein